MSSRAAELYSIMCVRVWRHQLYQPINVYMALVGMETWTTGSLITVNQSDSFQTLTNFALYRKSQINPLHRNDNGQLLTYDKNISYFFNY